MKVLLIVGSGGREHAIAWKVYPEALRQIRLTVHREMQELQSMQSA